MTSRRELYVIIGALAGYISFGTIGILVGVVLMLCVAKLDDKLIAFIEKKHQEEKYVSEVERRSNEGFRLMLLNVAGLTGTFTREMGGELEKKASLARELLIVEFGAEPSDIDLVFPEYYQSHSGNRSFEKFCEAYSAEYEGDEKKLEKTLSLLFRVAASTGRIEVAVEDLLCAASETFNITRTRYRQIRTQHKDALTSTTAELEVFYNLLECHKFVSNEELKKQYHELTGLVIKEGGQSSDAARKIMEIETAFKSICRARGISP